MKKHGFLLISVALLVFCAFVETVSAADIYVPNDYAKIQWTVDNATEGNTIIVKDGTYTENVDVNKSLTIRSENGAGSTIVRGADEEEFPVFNVTADYCDLGEMMSYKEDDEK